MNNRFCRNISVLTASLLICQVGFAQQPIDDDELSNLGSRTITTSVPFLMISPDARAGGLGDIGVATEADAASMHWNVGKLAFAQKDMSFNVSYTPWLRNLVPDINLAYLGFYKKIGNRTTIGASLRYFSLGDITFTGTDGTVIGNYNPNEFSIDVGASLKLSEYWSGGIAFRFIYSNLTLGQNVGTAPTNPGLAGSGDIGFYYENSDKKLFKKPVTWRFGFQIANIGSKIKYSDLQVNADFIPMNFRIGTSSTIQIDKYNKFMWSIEFAKLLVPSLPYYYADSVDGEGNRVIAKGMDPNRDVFSSMFTSFGDSPEGFYGEILEFTFATGVEYWYNNIFRASAGFFYEPAVSGNRQYFTLGAGVRYKVFGLDFSYLIPTVQRNPLENTVRFSLSFNFDKFGKGNNKKKRKDTAPTGMFNAGGVKHI